MHRNELKTIAEGLKRARPSLPSEDKTPLPGQQPEWRQWRRDVDSIADALQLVEKARSNFLAACGAVHGQ